MHCTWTVGPPLSAPGRDALVPVVVPWWCPNSFPPGPQSRFVPGARYVDRYRLNLRAHGGARENQRTNHQTRRRRVAVELTKPGPGGGGLCAPLALGNSGSCSSACGVVCPTRLAGPRGTPWTAPTLYSSPTPRPRATPRQCPPSRSHTSRARHRPHRQAPSRRRR